MDKNRTNPFTFGDLALDEAFTDREDEVAELLADMRNGQNVLVYAPRRYGKSSLVLKAAQEALSKKLLVGYVDLMKTPTKERLAAALAKTIYSDIASPIGQAFEKAADLFRDLRVRPTIEVDPSDGTLRFAFERRPPQERPRRDDREAPREARRACGRAQAPSRGRLRRVPGDPRPRQGLPEPDARRL